MQSVEKRLTVLLMRWAEQQRLGRPVSPEDLCRDCPDLLKEFKVQLQALEAIRSALGRDTRTAAFPAAGEATRHVIVGADDQRSKVTKSSANSVTAAWASSTAH